MPTGVEHVTASRFAELALALRRELAQPGRHAVPIVDADERLRGRPDYGAPLAVPHNELCACSDCETWQGALFEALYEVDDAAVTDDNAKLLLAARVVAAELRTLTGEADWTDEHVRDQVRAGFAAPLDGGAQPTVQPEQHAESPDSETWQRAVTMALRAVAAVTHPTEAESVKHAELWIAAKVLADEVHKQRGDAIDEALRAEVIAGMAPEPSELS